MTNGSAARIVPAGAAGPLPRLWATHDDGGSLSPPLRSKMTIPLSFTPAWATAGGGEPPAVATQTTLRLPMCLENAHPPRVSSR